jgi:hypothetical protein
MVSRSAATQIGHSRASSVRRKLSSLTASCNRRNASSVNESSGCSPLCLSLAISSRTRAKVSADVVSSLCLSLAVSFRKSAKSSTDFVSSNRNRPISLLLATVPACSLSTSFLRLLTLTAFACCRASSAFWPMVSESNGYAFRR